MEKMKLKPKRKEHDPNDLEAARIREQDQKYLELAENMKVLYRHYYCTWRDLLHERVQEQRTAIEARSQRWEDFLREKERKERQLRRQKLRNIDRHELCENVDFLESLPKSKFYYMVQLKEIWKKEGRLKTCWDEENFYKACQRKVDNPLTAFQLAQIREAQKSGSHSDDGSEIGSSNVVASPEDVIDPLRLPSPEKTLPSIPIETICEEDEEGDEKKSAPVTKGIVSAAPRPSIDQTLRLAPSTLGRQVRSGSIMAGPKKEELERIFPKPQFPKLHVLEMDVSWNNSQEAAKEMRRKEQELRELERRVTKQKLVNMYQTALTHMAVTNRMIEHEDLLHNEEKSSVVCDLMDISRSLEPRPPQTAPAALAARRALAGSKSAFSQPSTKHVKSEPLISRRRRQKPKAEISVVLPTAHSTECLVEDSELTEAAPLTLQAVFPTAVVKQTNWHRVMWDNYENVGVRNPDIESQKHEPNKSNLGAELAQLCGSRPGRVV